MLRRICWRRQRHVWMVPQQTVLLGRLGGGKLLVPQPRYVAVLLLRVSAGRGRPPLGRQLATSTWLLPTCQVGQQLLRLQYLLLADGPHRLQLVQNNRIAQDSKML